MVPALRRPPPHTRTHVLVGQCASKVLLDVGVHHWAKVEVLIVPEQVDDKDLKTGSDSCDQQVSVTTFTPTNCNTVKTSFLVPRWVTVSSDGSWTFERLIDYSSLFDPHQWLENQRSILLRVVIQNGEQSIQDVLEELFQTHKHIDTCLRCYVAPGEGAQCFNSHLDNLFATDVSQSSQNIHHPVRVRLPL